MDHICCLGDSFPGHEGGKSVWLIGRFSCPPPDKKETTMMALLSAIIGALAGAIVGACVTFLLSIWRFRAEKRWEKRVDTYEKIIDALHHARNYQAYFIDVEVEGRAIDRDETQKLAEKVKAANRQIELAISQGFLVLGDNVRDRLKQYRKDTEHNPVPRENWFGQIEHEWELADACLKDIIRFAQRDLDRMA